MVLSTARPNCCWPSHTLSILEWHYSSVVWFCFLFDFVLTNMEGVVVQDSENLLFYLVVDRTLPCWLLSQNSTLLTFELGITILMSQVCLMSSAWLKSGHSSMCLCHVLHSSRVKDNTGIPSPNLAWNCYHSRSHKWQVYSKDKQWVVDSKWGSRDGDIKTSSRWPDSTLPPA